METDYDEKVVDFCKIPSGKMVSSDFIVKMVIDVGLEEEVKKVNTMPLHLGVFVLSNSKKIMNNSFHAINGSDTNDLNSDTD